MPALTSRARHLVQLLAEELDKAEVPWTVLMSGHGDVGPNAWDWRVELGEENDEDWYACNSDTNRADVIPITRLRDKP